MAPFESESMMARRCAQLAERAFQRSLEAPNRRTRLRFFYEGEALREEAFAHALLSEEFLLLTRELSNRLEDPRSRALVHPTRPRPAARAHSRRRTEPPVAALVTTTFFQR